MNDIAIFSFTVPGPQYKFKTLVGYKGHCSTMFRNPAYSFGKILTFSYKSYSPGPKYMLKEPKREGYTFGMAAVRRGNKKYRFSYLYCSSVWWWHLLLDIFDRWHHWTWSEVQIAYWSWSWLLYEVEDRAEKGWQDARPWLRQAHCWRTCIYYVSLLAVSNAEFAINVVNL